MPIPRFPEPDLTIPTPPAQSEDLQRHPRLAKSFVYEPSSRWVRGVVGDTAVVDSRHQILVWEPESPVPEYAYPTAHVRSDLLVPSTNPEAAKKYWRPRSKEVEWFDLIVGKRKIPAAAWKWKVPGLESYIAFTWTEGVLDKWYEEDEVVFGHPRSPFARIDVIPTSRQVRVTADGVLLAESRNALALFETGLPTRFYLPGEDVKWEALSPVDMVTACPYKGYCDKYWSTPKLKGIAWSYRDPMHQVSAIKDRVAFYNEKVNLEVDGVAFKDNPQTWA